MTLAPLDHHDRLAERLAQVTDHLLTHRALWAARPFTLGHAPWERDVPALAAWLRALDHTQINALESDPDALGDAPPEPWGAWSRACADVSAVAPLPRSPAHRVAWTKRLRWKIPDRKRSQIEAFGAACLHAMPSAEPALRDGVVLDWCSGKGHLGRAMGAWCDLPVLHMERQGPLCTTGAKLDTRAGCTSRFVEVDVLRDDTAPHFNTSTLAVALHACGVLTNALLRQSADAGARGVACALCCHGFLGPQDTWHSMSEAAQTSGFTPDHTALRLSTADEVVARPRDRDARRRERAWRLGMDLLMREATGDDRYRSLGPLPRRTFRLPFEAFCHHIAQTQQLPLPARWNPAQAEAAAWERARITRALSLVRALFRRPLELWMVLDRALFLAERDRPVQLGTFCPHTLTPRNLMLTSFLP